MTLEETFTSSGTLLICKALQKWNYYVLLYYHVYKCSQPACRLIILMGRASFHGKQVQLLLFDKLSYQNIADLQSFAKRNEYSLVCCTMYTSEAYFQKVGSILAHWPMGI